MDIDAYMPQSPTRLAPTQCDSPKSFRPKKGNICLEDGSAVQHESSYKAQFVSMERSPAHNFAKSYDSPLVQQKFEGSSTARDSYVEYSEVRRSMPVRPTCNLRIEAGGLDSLSAYAAEYSPKSVPYVHAAGPTHNGTSQGEFYGQSTYGNDFKLACSGSPAKKILPTHNISALSGDFSGESSYNSTFTKHAGAAARRTLLLPKENGQVIPSGQFTDSTSVYKQQFAGASGVSVTLPFKPQDAMSVGGQATENLDGYATEYGNQYLNSPTGPKPPGLMKPVSSVELFPRGNFVTGSTYGSSYKEVESTFGRVRPIKPSAAMDHEHHVFDATSSYNSAFLGKTVPYERVNKNAKYQPNPNKFEGVSANHDAFKEYPVSRRVKGGPTAGGIAREEHVFEGVSAYKSEFTKMPGATRVQTIPQATEFMPTGKFQGQSTYRGEYAEQQLVPAVHC